MSKLENERVYSAHLARAGRGQLADLVLELGAAEIESSVWLQMILGAQLVEVRDEMDVFIGCTIWMNVAITRLIIDKRFKLRMRKSMNCVSVSWHWSRRLTTSCSGIFSFGVNVSLKRILGRFHINQA